jgi:hypothetical protein
MAAPRVGPQDLVARITRLERRQRMLTPVAALTIAGILAALAAFAPPSPGVVQAQRVELVSPKGEVLAPGRPTAAACYSRCWTGTAVPRQVIA